MSLQNGYSDSMIDKAYGTFSRWFKEVDEENMVVGSFGKGFFLIQGFPSLIAEFGVRGKWPYEAEKPVTLSGLAMKDLRGRTDQEEIDGTKRVNRPAALGGMFLGAACLYAWPLTGALDLLHGCEHGIKRIKE